MKRNKWLTGLFFTAVTVFGATSINAQHVRGTIVVPAPPLPPPPHVVIVPAPVPVPPEPRVYYRQERPRYYHHDRYYYHHRPYRRVYYRDDGYRGRPRGHAYGHYKHRRH